MSQRDQTIQTYNDSAAAFNSKFAGIGSRVKYVDIALDFLDPAIQNPRIVEIGCGTGRDAEYITTCTTDYQGFDLSEGLIAIAKQALPDTSFEVADAVLYDYPANTDVVFAFASLLHLDKLEVEQVFQKVEQSLNIGGICYISTKFRPQYSQDMQTDEFGERLFYYYNFELLKQLAGNGFKSVYEESITIGKTEWIELALKKIS